MMKALVKVMSARQSSRQPLLDLIAKGWKATYAEIFGKGFVDVLDSLETDDKHHSEAIGWHWDSRIALLTGKEPEFFAYFPIWARGNMKSTIAESIVVMDALLSYAYNQPGYCLYIGREKDRVKENVGNLESLLSMPSIRKYAPDLSEVARNEETNSKRQWTGTFLHTKANYIIKGGTVESSQAGSRIRHLDTGDGVKDSRVTLFVPDDIDNRNDSAVESETRFRLLTTEILPMKQANTLTFFAQNLISRYSVMYRIQKGGAKVLTNRKPTKPIPAVRNLVTEQRVVNDIVKDVVVSGQPTWRAWDLQRVQQEIDTMGLPSFLREMQHEVEQSKEGLVHSRYDDNVHAISLSQFEAVYGKDAWKYWAKVVANDWARTKTKFHANVAAYATVSSQNTPEPGLTFLMPYSFPADTQPEDVAVRLLSELTPYAVNELGRQMTWANLVQDAWKRMNEEEHFDSARDRLDFLGKYYARIIPKYSQPVLERYNVTGAVNSHSEDKVRQMFNEGFGFSFVPANPREHEGIEEIQAAMRVDYTEKHLFKDCMGYTRWYVICKDDLTAEPTIVNGHTVYPPVPYPDDLSPDTLHDDDLFRYQLSNRRYRDPILSATGEAIDHLEKTNDDFPQLLQFIYFRRMLNNLSYSKEELREMKKPEIYKNPTEANKVGALLWAQRQHKIEEEESRARKSPLSAWDQSRGSKRL